MKTTSATTSPRSLPKLFRGLLVLCALLVSVSAQAQGCFTFLTDSIGCVPLRVDFSNCYTPGQPVSYNFDFVRNPGAASFITVRPPGDTFNVYTAVGIYDVRQVVSGGSLARAARRQVRVYEPNSKPIFRLSSCPGQIRIFLTDSIFRQCRVGWLAQNRTINVPKGGIAVDLPAPVSAETRIAVTVTGTSPSNCGNTTLIDSVTIYPTLPPPLITSATEPGPGSLTANFSVLRDVAYRLLTDGGAVLEDSLRLTTSQTISRDYTLTDSPRFHLILQQGIGCAQISADTLLCINPAPVSPATALTFPALSPEPASTLALLLPDGSAQTLAATDTLFRDTIPYRCNEQRCYSLRVSSLGETCTSYPVCLRSQIGAGGSLPLRASVWDDSLKRHVLSFTGSAAVAGFSGTGFQVEGVFPPSVSLLQPACVQIGYSDSCGNAINPDSSYCPLILQGSLDRDRRTLSFTPPSGPAIGVRFTYVMEVFAATTGLLLETRPVSGSPVRDQSRFPDQRLIYRIKAIPEAHPGDTSISNPVELVRKAEIILPEAFSPNDDGLNDTLTAQARFIEEATISIFDTWGTPVYKGGLPFAWAGDSPRGKVPAGTYLAVIRAKTQEGETFTLRQWVSLVQ